MSLYLKEPEPASHSLGQHPEPFFSWSRLVRECLCIGFVVSYVVIACLLLSSSPSVPEGVLLESSPIESLGSRRGGCANRPRVHVQCGRSGMYWTVREGGIVFADEVHPQTLFRIEPVADPDGANTSFAIRHVESLRLVTVSAPGSDGEYILRLGPLRAATPYDLFAVRSLSLLSVGVGGFVNHRERTKVRAHGNVEPWQPMRVETATTRIILREVACHNPHLVEDALLGMVDALQQRGLALPAPFPGTAKSSEQRARPRAQSPASLRDASSRERFRRERRSALLGLSSTRGPVAGFGVT